MWQQMLFIKLSFGLIHNTAFVAMPRICIKMHFAMKLQISVYVLCLGWIFLNYIDDKSRCNACSWSSVHWIYYEWICDLYVSKDAAVLEIEWVMLM